jgi:hypothetical protein
MSIELKIKFHRLLNALGSYIRKYKISNHTCRDVHLLSKLSRNLGNLLHCNTMNFDSFSLGARHLFQNVVLLKKKILI